MDACTIPQRKPCERLTWGFKECPLEITASDGARLFIDFDGGEERDDIRVGRNRRRDSWHTAVAYVGKLTRRDSAAR